jgi:nicotinate-nucleotide adenylyltransferase
MKKVGLLGGTFDPVHKGHIELAYQTMEYCDLSKIVFIPSYFPPHKPFKKISSFTDRVEMLKIATSNEERFAISEIEENIGRPCYTIDMLSKLLFPGAIDSEYYFIIGIDAFIEIPTWKNYLKVLEFVNFIVSSRSEYNPILFDETIKKLGYRKNNNKYWHKLSSNRRIYFLDTNISNVSSSEVREKVLNNENIEDLVGEAVQKYIVANKLFVS